jgi:hypothetical protein
VTPLADPGLADRVRSALVPHPGIRSVGLVGSRARGDAVPLSDWDFAVEATDFEGVAADLPALVAVLDPLAAQWDRLNETWCYMLTLAGPAKVDLIFDVPHRDEPPWVVTAEALPAIDRHFWDWILWLASKHQRGDQARVRTELAKMSRHLLGPLGIVAVPRSIGEAVDRYRPARDRAAAAAGTSVALHLEREVKPAVLEAVRASWPRPARRETGGEVEYRASEGSAPEGA